MNIDERIATLEKKLADLEALNQSQSKNLKCFLDACEEFKMELEIRVKSQAPV